MVFFGHGFGENGHGVYLGWMPLRPGREPTASDVRYFRGGANPWSHRQQDARALFTTRFSWTSLSAGRLPDDGYWIVLYQKTGQIEENEVNGTWDEGIVGRIAATPWEIAFAPEIRLFAPDAQQARGRFMSRQPKPPADPDETVWPPVDHPSFVYGAYLLNRYTRSTPLGPGVRGVTINYLMSTGCPYQVQLMESIVRFDEA